MKNLTNILTIGIGLFFAVLFSYATVIKTSGFKYFRTQLDQAPGLVGYGEPVAYGLVALQTLSVILLCYRPFRYGGLCLTFGMVTVFAGYIALILMDSTNLPCTCIGFFEKMTWKENLVLNIALMITALTGIITLKAGRSK